MHASSQSTAGYSLPASAFAPHVPTNASMRLRYSASVSMPQIYTLTAALSTRTVKPMSERERPDWMARGACASGEYDRDLWFPEPVEGRYSSKGAQKICNTKCPVRDECREYAVTFPALLKGVWGGLSYREVRAQRLKRGLAAMTESELSALPKDWGQR